MTTNKVIRLVPPAVARRSEPVADQQAIEFLMQIAAAIKSGRAKGFSGVIDMGDGTFGEVRTTSCLGDNWENTVRALGTLMRRP